MTSSDTSFTDDQLVFLIEYLESQRKAGYTLEDVIEGIEDGSLIKPTYHSINGVASQS